MEYVRFSVYGIAMKDNDFERCFFETALEYGIKKYGRQKKFAAAVFPEMTEDSANSTLMQIKKRSSKTGVPRLIRLCEAFRMAEAAGQSFSSLALEVETKLRLGWSEDLGGGQLTLVPSLEKNEAPQDEGRTERSVLSPVAVAGNQPGTGV